MNNRAIDNLNGIINILKYPHICFNPSELTQFTNIPWQWKKYYPINSRYPMASVNNKRGFFNNGKTLCWDDYRIQPGTIKIATRIPTDVDNGWSEPLSFENEGDAHVIYRYMKLKVFW